MKLYRKFVQVRSFGYTDYSEGKVVQDWIPEEELDMTKIKYEYSYSIIDKFVPYKDGKEEDE
jgi:hypothetical protein